jgi:hypothetical protein
MELKEGNAVVEVLEDEDGIRIYKSFYSEKEAITKSSNYFLAEELIDLYFLLTNDLNAELTVEESAYNDTVKSTPKYPVSHLLDKFVNASPESETQILKFEYYDAKVIFQIINRVRETKWITSDIWKTNEITRLKDAISYVLNYCHLKEQTEPNMKWKG